MSTPAPAAPQRILVVDDEKNIRLTLRHALEAEGVAVEAVADGEAALERLRDEDERFALMLLDLKMPGIGGMEVLDEAQALRPALPVIVFTAHGSADYATEAMKRGAADFIEKPFTPTEIRALVEEVRARPSGLPAAEEDAPAPRSSPNRSYRALVFLTDPATEEALLRLAAASAHPHGERAEVVIVGVGATAAADAKPPVNLGAAKGRAKDLGVELRVREAASGDAAEALPEAVRAEQPDHVLFEWKGTPAEARALDALAERLAGEAGCEVTLVRPGERAGAATAALASEGAYALIAVRRALEFAKSAGVASLTLLNVQPLHVEDEEEATRSGLRLIHKVARKAGLPEGKYYTQITAARDVKQALPRAAEDFDTICLSATYAPALVPALFDEESDRRITGTVAVVRGPAHAPPPQQGIVASLIERLSGG